MASHQQLTRTSINWREVILFSVLAYAASWLWWGFKLYPYLGQLSLTESPKDLVDKIGFLDLVIGDFGPLVAAVIMRLFISKEVLKGSLGLLRSWKYYLIALIAPPIFFSIVVLFNHVTGVGTFVWTGRVPGWPMELPLWAYYLSLLINTVFITIFVFGEEYGWRGYLLPRLLPFGEIKATVIVGLIWSFWHLPLIFAGMNFPGQNPLLATLVFTFTVVFLSFAFTWFYIVTGGSVLLAGILHGSTNAYGDGLTSRELIPNGNPLLVSSAGLVTGIFLMVLTLVVYVVFKRSPEVKDLERLRRPQLDGTWRDWLR